MKYCSVQRWLRWHQAFSKKLILKGTSPSFKLRNVWRNLSALERAYGLKFRGKALFLIRNTMTEIFFQYTIILVNLGIKFESHHWWNHKINLNENYRFWNQTIYKRFESNLWFLIFRKARIKECNNTRKTHIFGTKNKTPLQNLTLIPMIQTVFENFEIFTKIIQSQSSLHFE